MEPTAFLRWKPSESTSENVVAPPRVLQQFCICKAEECYPQRRTESPDGFYFGIWKDVL